MIRPIRLFTESILHKTTELVTNFNSEELTQLSQDMLETMIVCRGIGLAANQIGVNKNLCVLSLENKTKQIILANLRILCYSKEKDIQVEGCLSAPGISVNVKRPIWVEVEAQLLNGEKASYRFEGFDSRIVQHEIDHLNGKMIINNKQNIVRK